MVDVVVVVVIVDVSVPVAVVVSENSPVGIPVLPRTPAYSACALAEDVSANAAVQPSVAMKMRDFMITSFSALQHLHRSLV